MIVTGIEHCSFTNKEGKEVTFERVTLLSDIPEKRGEGQAAEVVNVGSDKIVGLSIGDEVEVLYNKYGKVSRFDYVG